MASAAVHSKATVVVLLNQLLTFLFYLFFGGLGNYLGGGHKPVFSLVNGYVLWFEMYSNVPLV